MTAQPRPARAAMTDAELDAFVAALPPCPDLPSTPEEEEAADRRALSDVAHGRVHPHHLVAAWMAACRGTGHTPFEEWYSQRNG